MHAKPKKSLGQNFLTDQNILKKIVHTCGFCEKDIVLEIGAGRGGLTRLVAPHVKKIFAVEIDRNLYKSLRQEFNQHEGVVDIINQDILKFDLNRHLGGLRDKVIVAGNIPYYITTPIIEYLLDNRDRIRSAYLTVQKEFARRIVASAGGKEYGALTCFVQYYTEPKILFNIKRNSFFPSPKVDSCFLKLRVRSHPAVDVEDQAWFFRIVRSAFNQRRKTLKNSLQELIPQAKLKEFLGICGIDSNARPERLTLQDFANLANTAKK